MATIIILLAYDGHGSSDNKVLNFVVIFGAL